jgi:hypothetical protein
MAVETEDDRGAYLADFGVGVTWTRASVAQTFLGIFDRPSTMVDGLGEVMAIDRDASLLVIEADLPAGAAEDDPVAVEGESQAFACKNIRRDGQGFAVIDLKKA